MARPAGRTGLADALGAQRAVTDEKWKVDASHHVLEDRWIRVRADDCTTAEGAKVAPYYVLEYPDWVQVVAVSPQGQVLMVRQYRHAWGDYSVELPAGAMDPSDTGVLAAAARELIEETGCVGDSLEVIGSFSPNPATHANTIHTVLVKGAREVQAHADDPTERIEHFWVSPGEALELMRSGVMITSIQMASLFLALLRLGVLQAAEAS